jgi:thioesterase domain-containing protein
VEELASFIRRRENPRNRSSLVLMQPLGSNPPIFCVHPSGGNIICYADLARCLRPDQPFYGLEAKGIYGEGKPYTQIKELAKYYIKAIRKVQKKGPYLIAGWSMGGTVAFEMAQQLHSQGHKIALLALFDTTASVSDNDREIEKKDDAIVLAHLFRDLLSISADEIMPLKPEERMLYILEKAREQDKVPFDISPAEMEATFQVFKANARAMNAYIPRTYDGRITLFKAGFRPALDATLGWGTLARGGVDVQEVSGSHLTLVKQPHVQILAERLKACIKAIGY